MNAAHQFREAILSSGLMPPDAIEPGKLHRFQSNGKRGDDAGWCKLFPDLGGGIYGDHRTGLYEVWQAKRDRPLAPAEYEAFRQRCEHERHAREAEEARKHAEAALKSAAVWKTAEPAVKDHPYLSRKGVKPAATLREISSDRLAAILGYTPKSKGEALAGRILIAPVKVGDKVSTAELIDEAGRKSAVFGGIKAGGYWATEPLPDNLDVLLIGEGVATVLSASEATGCHAIAALSSGNLEPVAIAMREKYPHARLVILGDLGNGQGKAESAAKATSGLLALPQFGEDEIIHGKTPSDFNDLSALHGLDAVKRAIEGANLSYTSIQGHPRESATHDNFASAVKLVRGCDLKPEAVQWLWNGWLAAGKMHILGGAPGTGKTTISMALAATITRGGCWPDGTRTQVGNVVIWSGEDDPADTLVPRLALSGADLSRVYFISEVSDGNEGRPFDPAKDMEPLRRKLAEIGNVRLLIIDPIVSAVTGDGNSNPQVRRNLQPLADLASSMRCALLGITHFTKGTPGRDPVERINGSIAFGALARVVLVAAKHQEKGEDGCTVRLFLRAKSNIGPDDGGFEYDLHQGELERHPGIFASAVQWGVAVEGAARELLATAEETTGEAGGDSVASVSDWLHSLLTEEGGKVDRRDVMRAANAMGYKERTVHRAREKLGLRVAQSGFGKDKRSLWTWSDAAIPAPFVPIMPAQIPGTHGTNGGTHEETDLEEIEF